MKQCPDCLKEGIGPKPLSEFCRDRQQASGLAVYCRPHKVARCVCSGRATPERRAARVAAVLRWRAKHPEKAKAVQKEQNRLWRIRHPERAAASDAAKRATPEGRAKYRELDKRKRAAKPWLYRAIKRARKAAVRLRTPAWANIDAIKALYECAEGKTRETGILHHVDHVVPLQGRRVSGLHVETNLQVLPAAENLRKNRRHESDFEFDLRDLERAV